MEYQPFLNIFLEVLNKHAPMKQKYLRANQGRFMTKILRKAIIKHSRLRNKILSDRTEMSRKEYKKQRNFCVNLLKRAKKEHFTNLDRNSLSQITKNFGRLLNLFFQIKLKVKQLSN